jgi:hypothetical protein
MTDPTFKAALDDAFRPQPAIHRKDSLMADKLETLLRGVVNPHGGTDVPALADRIKGMYPGFNYLDMEAALCVWECLNEWTLGDSINGPGQPAWIELREGIGAAEMRHQSIALGKWCLEIFDICTKRDRDFFDGVSYDWEVIPLILRYAEDAEGRPVIYAEHLPSAEQTALLVAHQHLRNEFVRSCRHEAQKQWAYGDLVEDNPPDIDKGFESGDEPAAFIKQLGESLDLIDFGPWK